MLQLDIKAVHTAGVLLVLVIWVVDPKCVDHGVADFVYVELQEHSKVHHTVQAQHGIGHQVLHLWEE